MNVFCNSTKNLSRHPGRGECCANQTTRNTLVKFYCYFLCEPHVIYIKHLFRQLEKDQWFAYPMEKFRPPLRKKLSKTEYSLLSVVMNDEGNNYNCIITFIMCIITVYII